MTYEFDSRIYSRKNYLILQASMSFLAILTLLTILLLDSIMTMHLFVVIVISLFVMLATLHFLLFRNATCKICESKIKVKFEKINQDFVEKMKTSPNLDLKIKHKLRFINASNAHRFGGYLAKCENCKKIAVLSIADCRSG